MSVTTECSCGRKLKAKDVAAGKTAKCPACGNLVTFPELVPQTEDPFISPTGDSPAELEQAHEPPPLPNAEWHYSRGGKRHGPVTFQTAQQLASLGELKLSDLVWKNGMADWQQASTITGLFIQTNQTHPANRSKVLLYALGVSGLAVFLLVCWVLGNSPINQPQPDQATKESPSPAKIPTNAELASLLQGRVSEIEDGFRLRGYDILDSRYDVQNTNSVVSPLIGIVKTKVRKTGVTVLSTCTFRFQDNLWVEDTKRAEVLPQ